MKKNFKFLGEGSIEFSLPSVPVSVTVKHKESIILDVQEQDLRTINQLRDLKLVITDVKEESPKEESPKEESPKEERTINSLMSLTAVQLKALAISEGVAFPEGASKKEIATLILNQ